MNDRPGFDSHFPRGAFFPFSTWGFFPPFHMGLFSRSSHTSDFRIGTPMATLPGTRCYRVSAQTGWPECHCQHTVTMARSKLDLQLLYQCGSIYNCLSRSLSEIH